MAVRAERHGDGLDAVLVRLPVAEGRWAEAVPPAPGSHRVSVSFSSETGAMEHGEALEFLGFSVVDGPAWPPGTDFAWILVPNDLVAEHPAWWDAVTGQADRVYALAFGPALRLLGPVVAAHLEGCRDGG